MNYLFFIPLGLAPSIIWLLFYLRKDVHPESNKMIVKIFFYGMLAAIIAAGIEIGISLTLTMLAPELPHIFPIAFFIVSHFIIIALVEELSKFLIVKEKAIKDPEFDEPMDAMLYMIITALGFAALENLLVLFPETNFPILKEALAISVFRFIGATFLHALSSGALGYFLALSIFEPKKRIKLISLGVTLATVLHGFFNIFIIGIEKSIINENQPLLIALIAALAILLIGLSFFVSFGFRKLKKLASVCKTT